VTSWGAPECSSRSRRAGGRAQTPHVAIVAYAALAAGLALSGTFAELAVLSALAVSPLYIAGCAAAWKLARSGVARAGEPLQFRWLGAAAVVGGAGMLLMIALASRTELAGLLALFALCAASYAPLSRRAARSQKNA
jgi:hypothetical protein